MGENSKPIVVGFDGTPPSAEAVEWAARQADRRGCPLVVAHAAVYALLPGPMGTVPFRPDLFEAEAKQLAQEGSELAGKFMDRAKVRAHSAIAGAVSILVDASTKAQLVVVGSRGHGQFGSLMLGSVAYSVTLQSRCTVVVVGGANAQSLVMPGPEHPVLVGVDGSEAATAAVRFAADTASDAGAQLIVATTYRSSAYATWSDVYAFESDGLSYDSVMRQAAEQVTDEAMRLARTVHPDLAIEQHTPQGNPAMELSRLAEGCGLAVVGSRGRGAFAGLVLGSASHGLLHLSPCPVAVVR